MNGGASRPYTQNLTESRLNTLYGPNLSSVHAPKIYPRLSAVIVGIKHIKRSMALPGITFPHTLEAQPLARSHIEESECMKRRMHAGLRRTDQGTYSAPCAKYVLLWHRILLGTRGLAMSGFEGKSVDVLSALCNMNP